MVDRDGRMTGEDVILPAGLHLTFDPDPSLETRRALGAAINAFHARTVPLDSERFALLLRDDVRRLLAGSSGAVFWAWLFVEGLWVSEGLRGRGIGRMLMTAAEDCARAKDCHSAWLDTFQAGGSTRSWVRAVRCAGGLSARAGPVFHAEAAAAGSVGRGEVGFVTLAVGARMVAKQGGKRSAFRHFR